MSGRQLLDGIVKARRERKKPQPEETPEEDSAIFALACEGNVTAMKQFLAKWERNEKKNIRKGSKTAVASSQEESMPKLILNTIMNLHRRVKHTTPLMECAARGNVEMIRSVLLPGCIGAINTQDINGFSALAYAAKNGRTEVVNVLLNYGASPLLEEKHSERSAWYWAVSKGYTEIAVMLLERVPTLVNLRIFQDRSCALIEAGKHGHVEMFTALLNSPNVKVNLADAFGKTALDYVELFKRTSVRAKVSPATRAGNDGSQIIPDVNSLADRIRAGDLFSVQQILILRKLKKQSISNLSLAQPSNTSGLNGNGILKSAIADAIGQNDVGIVQEIIKYMDLDETQLRELVSSAASQGYVRIVKALLKSEISTNRTAELALETAVREGRYILVEQILKLLGGSITNFQFEKCLSISCEKGHYSVVEKLLDYHKPGSKFWKGGYIQQCFVAAVLKGNAFTMKSIVNKGFVIRNNYISVTKDESTDQHVSLWEYACVKDNLHILHALLECYEAHSVNTEIKKRLGPPLLHCVRLKNLKAVRLFLNPGKPWSAAVNPNVKNSRGLTALHEAILGDRNGSNYEMVRVILAHPEVDPNTFCFEGENHSPIQDCKNDEIAKLLLKDPRLDLRLKNNYGISALIQMAMSGRHEQMKYLLEVDHSRPVINAVDGEMQTPLMKTCVTDRSYVYHAREISNWVKCAKVLLQYDTLDLGKQDFGGKTAFIHAADSQKHRVKLPPEGDVLEVLIDHGIKNKVDIGLTSTDNVGNNALMFACFQNNERTIRTLLKHFRVEDVAHLNQNGVSSFDEAVEGGKVEIVRILVEYDKQHPGGINVNGRSPMGLTPLNRACACRNPKLEIVRLLLKHPTFNSINVKREPEMWTPLMILAASRSQSAGSVRVFKELLNHSAATVNPRDGNNATPLMYAVKRTGNPQILRCLLDHHEVDINMKDSDGRNALMYAVVDNCEGSLKQLLMEPDLDINATDNAGANVLHLAAREGHFSLARILVTMGRSLRTRARDGQGKTAEEVAREVAEGLEGGRITEHIALADFLMKQGAVSGKRIPSYYLEDAKASDELEEITEKSEYSADDTLESVKEDDDVETLSTNS